VIRHKIDPRLLAGLIAAHVVVAILTWWDIGRREPNQIRGPKWIWRIASAVQMGNALVYWVFGRRTTSAEGAHQSALH
jgi:hypothetical protein